MRTTPVFEVAAREPAEATSNPGSGILREYELTLV